MKKRLNVFMAVMFTLILVLAGCTTTGSDNTKKDPNKDNPTGEGTEKKVLRTVNGSEPGSLHPGTAQGTHDSWILEHAFEGLTTKSPEGEILPGMAEKWETSEDGLTWTFHLKEGMKWSNGDPVVAGDFEYAWKYALDPNTASQYAYQLYYLEGAVEFNSIGAEERKKAADEERDPKPVPEEELKAARDKVGVKAKDDKTLEVKLAASTPYFLDLTSFYTYYPINQKVQEANPEWYKSADNYVSNGPFVLKEWNHKENLVLAKNENYYDKDKIKLDEVNLLVLEDENTAWQMYQSGEVDLLHALPVDVTGQLIANKSADFHNASDLATYYYNFNGKVKPFNNAKVRKALSMAIDRKTVTEHVSQGGQMPAYGVIPPGMPDVSGDFRENGGELFKEDVEEAKKLLKEGLQEEGMSKFPKTVLLYNTHDAHKAIAEAIQEMWRKNLGIDNITLENVEMQVKLDREQGGDYQISRAGWVGDYVDPMTFMDLWVTDGPYNDAEWSNKEYDALIEKAKKTMDVAERMDAMHKAEQILINEMPIAPIYYYSKPHAYKEYVTGVYTPINRYPQFKYADINKK